MAKHSVERLCKDVISIPAELRIVRDQDARSPYAKYGKREYRYSTAYYEWRRSITGKKHRTEVDHDAT